MPQLCCTFSEPQSEVSLLFLFNFILSNVYLLIYALNLYFREELPLFLHWALCLTSDLTPLEILLDEMKNVMMVKKLGLRVAFFRAFYILYLMEALIWAEVVRSLILSHFQMVEFFIASTISIHFFHFLKTFLI